MSQRPAKPANMSWMSPYLTVRDAAKAIEFYEAAFGFRTRDAVPGPDSRIMHAKMAWNDSVLMLGPEGPQCPSKAPATSGTPCPFTIYAYCEDVDALHRRATAAGAKSVIEPQDMFWGDRMCQLADPDGYLWCFATNVADEAYKTGGCTAPAGAAS
jgi:PhnB protein